MISFISWILLLLFDKGQLFEWTPWKEWSEQQSGLFWALNELFSRTLIRSKVKLSWNPPFPPCSWRHSVDFKFNLPAILPFRYAHHCHPLMDFSFSFSFGCFTERRVVLIISRTVPFNETWKWIGAFFKIKS